MSHLKSHIELYTDNDHQYANVMGISTDLKLDPKSNQFSNIASAFFIAYLIAEVPTGKHPSKLRITLS